MDFVHLHVHSHYSLLDGSIKIKDLVTRTKELGMTSLALTDHGNLFGAIEFYNEAKQAGIKPIMGIEAYISPTTRQDRSMGNPMTSAYHLILLAMNATGWRNLIKLSSLSYLEGFYYKPRIDRELLAKYSEGLIASTACLGGEIPAALMADDYDKARKLAGGYVDIFGRDRFFIEIMNQGEPDQDRINPGLARLAKELKVGVIGTNDVHFLTRDDKKAHEVLTCISTGKKLSDQSGLNYSPELYLKSPQEMAAAFKEWPEAVENTVHIGSLCDVQLDFKTKHLPVFRPPGGESADDYMSRLAWDGLARRFEGGAIPEAYRQRLEWELSVIKAKGYSSYFLIVNDFVQFAHRENIPAAPRGSGVATLLGYALGVADVDPLRYGLLFERFTDPQRKEDPDIDIDICQEGRERVIQYVRDRYKHVAQIITYGTLKPRAAIRDVGRVLDIPIAEVDAITKKVPEDLKVTIAKAIEAEPDFRKRLEEDQRFRDLMDHAERLQGLARHSGVHAAGVVVCDEPLDNLVPLYKQASSDDVITQWDGPTCEKVGMMKMDFLGLRTLTIIQRARELVRKRTGTDIDPEKITLDDQNILDIFRQGQTMGIFQFESDGMRGVLQQMQPNRIEDLIAANAMYRPGPMELIGDYCNRKKKTVPVPPVHPLVDDLLAETYGIMVYQEQVMQVLNRLGKLPLNRALTLIKAISKKKEDVIKSERPNFMAGAQENGIDQSRANELFDLILKFAGYGFNKAHSTRYAIIAYQTAYFKVLYPCEFLAASLTFECGDRDKVAAFMAEAERMKVIIAPPDINTSESDFTVDGDQVRFGLAAVKGVGEGAVDAIVKARQATGAFQDIFHFCKTVDSRSVNRSAIESLIRCGAFDATASGGAHRAAMLAVIDAAVQAAQSVARDREAGQMNFFEQHEQAVKPQFPPVKEWSQEELLAAEKETLGFYITGHPLAQFHVELACLNQPAGITLARAGEVKPDTQIGIGCMVTHLRPMVMKKGQSAGRKMAMFVVEDLHGKMDGVMFADVFEKYAESFKVDTFVYLIGTIDTSRAQPNIKVNEVLPLKQVAEKFTESIALRVRTSELNEAFYSTIKAIVGRYKGSCPLLIEIVDDADHVLSITIKADHTFQVRANSELLAALQKAAGIDRIHLNPRPLPALPDKRQRRFGNNGGR